MSEKQLFPAYTGLSRVAMAAGVPLVPLVMVAGIFALLAVIAAAVMGPGGLLVGTAALPILFFIRQMCETDDQALRILGLEIMCWLHRAKCRLYGKCLTLAPIQYGSRLSTYRDAFRKPR